MKTVKAKNTKLDVKTREKLSEQFEGAKLHTHIFNAYAGSFGSSAAPSKLKLVNFTKCNPYWFSCREEFLAYSFKRDKQQFMFTHGPKKFNDIAKFIELCENSLKLRKSDRLILKPLSTNVSIVILSNWWRSTMARRQVLTILLRSANSYSHAKRNFNQALYSNRYANATKHSINRFLQGYTKTKAIMTARYGWVSKFRGKLPSEVRKLLTK